MPFGELNSLELATTMPVGRRRRPPETLPEWDGSPPLQALERALLPALQRAPCVVSFSGGRDSSAVLAVAVNLARREGLPLPVPVTLRFPRAARTFEGTSQERVVRHLGLREWSRPMLTDELDLAGDIALDILRRHGSYLPCNLHFHVPVLRQAVGGSLLTGVGGDEVFNRYDDSVRRAVHEVRLHRSTSAARSLAVRLLPRALRTVAHRRLRPLELPWLTPRAREVLQRWWAARAVEPLGGYPVVLQQLLSGRLKEIQDDGMHLLAEEHRVRVVHPLFAPEFLTALAATTPQHGFDDRTAAMRQLFGHLLPPETAARERKAVFNEVFWGERSAQVALAWDGSGLDEEVVDVPALKAVWTQGEQPHWRSWALLQRVALRTTL